MRYFLRRGLALAAFMVFLTATARGQAADTVSAEKPFARNMIVLNAGFFTSIYPYCGLEYERFLPDNFSVSAGISFPYIRPHVNGLVSGWLGNARIYGGLNLTAQFYPWANYGSVWFFGLKLGYQHCPQQGGTSIGIHVFQSLAGYYTESHTSKSTYEIGSTSIGIDIGYIF